MRQQNGTTLNAQLERLRAFGRIPWLCAIAIAIAITIGCNGETKPRANAADIVFQPLPAPEVPLSRFNAPLDYDFTAILRVVERVVPTTFGSMDDIHNMGGDENKRYAYIATRGPFTAVADGPIVRLSATLSYAARGWIKPPIGPTISAGCGDKETNDADRPRIIVEMSTPLTLTENWHLESHAKLDKLKPASDAERDRCMVSFMQFDITDKVIEAATSALKKHLPMIDQKIANVDLTNRFTEWWGLLHKPIRLTDSVWLLLAPEQLRVGSVTGSGHTLTVDAGLDAHPKIITGPRPAVDTTPLPPLVRTSVADGFYIAIEGVIDYETASRAVTAALEGKSITQAGNTVKVDSVVVKPASNGRIILSVTFTGDANGTLQFIGLPHYDPGKAELMVPDLNYDLETDNDLINAYTWLRSDALRDLFREKARVPVAPVLEKGKEFLLLGLNRKIGSAVTLEATVSSVSVRGLYVTEAGILVRGEAHGEAGMSVKQK